MPKNHEPGFYHPRLFRASVFTISWLGCSIVLAGSDKSEAAATVAPSPRFDCCALLSAEEIEAVQRSPVKDKRNSERANAGLVMTQCIYVAADFAQSVSLAISQPDPSDSAKRSIAGYWNEMFGRYSKPEQSRESAKRSAGPHKEEKEGAPPQKVEGVGDDAYWLADRVGGALYVLKKDAILRLSLGGKDKEETKLEKSKALAEKALARL